MKMNLSTLACLVASLLLVWTGATALAASEDLGNGFRDHGVATPVSSARGIVATANGEGENVVLVWLFDHRGGYGILMINADTGESRTFPAPFPPGGDTPYASILSSGNKYYTHFNSHFVEFDPEKPGFTFHHETRPRMAMSMTEDDRGRIWSATYPNSGLVSYDPETGVFKDYGYLHEANWRQYPRTTAADDAGWVYFGVGSTESHIIGLNPETEESKPMVPESARRSGERAVVFRATDGKVYGHMGEGERWYRLYNGRATKLNSEPDVEKKDIITGTQGLFHRRFPDGQRVVRVDLLDRVLVVEAPETGRTKRIEFDYTSEGAHIMSIATAPNGTVSGGTTFPMRFFSYDPSTDSWTRRDAYGQWNTVAATEDRFFVGGYPHGFMLEWNPAEPWVETSRRNANSNPRFLAAADPIINRPHDLLAHTNGELVILAGTPDYGLTGGGLMFWDREEEKATILEDEQILKNHATQSLVALPGGKLLGGSTIRPGTGGEQKAEQAEMYIMDIASKKLEWHEPLFPKAETYNDMIMTDSGMVYGFVDRERFFVFDPESRRVVHKQNTAEEFGHTNWQQGPRIFVKGPNGTIYVLFQRGIAKVHPDSYEIEMLAESPVAIGPGGTYLDGRIYFGHGSHVYSWEVPNN